MQIADLILSGTGTSPWLKLEFKIAFEGEDYPLGNERLLKLAGEGLIELSKRYVETENSAV